MPADAAAASGGPAQLDALVAEWLLHSTTLSRQQKLRLLKEEMRALHPHTRHRAGDSSTTDAVGSRGATLVSAMETVEASPDAATLRDGAELLTVSTDLDTLYDVLDAACVLDLSFNATTAHAAAVGADAVVDELCEQQESILGCRGDLAGRRSGAAPSGITRRRSSGGNALVRAVSEVKSWVCQPSAGTASRGLPCPQVGTQLTYFADTERTAPVFTLHTTCTFTADGTAVEHVSRTLLTHDAFQADEILKEIHFGTFSERARHPGTHRAA